MNDFFKELHARQARQAAAFLFSIGRKIVTIASILLDGSEKSLPQLPSDTSDEALFNNTEVVDDASKKALQ